MFQRHWCFLTRKRNANGNSLVSCRKTCCFTDSTLPARHQKPLHTTAGKPANKVVDHVFSCLGNRFCCRAGSRPPKVAGVWPCAKSTALPLFVGNAGSCCGLSGLRTIVLGEENEMRLEVTHTRAFPPFGPVLRRVSFSSLEHGTCLTVFSARCPPAMTALSPRQSKRLLSFRFRKNPLSRLFCPHQPRYCVKTLFPLSSSQLGGRQRVGRFLCFCRTVLFDGDRRDGYEGQRKCRSDVSPVGFLHTQPTKPS